MPKNTFSGQDPQRGSTTPTLLHPAAKIEHMYETAQRTCECGKVASSAAFTYSMQGHESDVTDVSWNNQASCHGRMVLVAELDHIDYVADFDEDLLSSVQPLAEQVQAGWDVWAVVPLSRLAEAHNTYRDQIPFVQGWWETAPGEIAFTEPEVP